MDARSDTGMNQHAPHLEPTLEPFTVNIEIGRADCHPVPIKALLDHHATNYFLAQSLLLDLGFSFDRLISLEGDPPRIDGFIGWLIWTFVYPCHPETSLQTRFAVVDKIEGPEMVILGRDEYDRCWEINDKGVLVLVVDKGPKRSKGENYLTLTKTQDCKLTVLRGGATPPTRKRRLQKRRNSFETGSSCQSPGQAGGRKEARASEEEQTCMKRPNGPDECQSCR